MNPFNSTLETGIRALIVLEAFYPRRCDLMELTWFDHLVVHTGDFGGEDAPESLHPDLPNRAAELLVRRELVEKSLRMMQKAHLVDVIETEGGLEFCAGEYSPSYIDVLQSPYSKALKERAKWMADCFASKERLEVCEIISTRLGRWTAELTNSATLSGREV